MISPCWILSQETYELSECIKWGYPNSITIVPLSIDATSELLGSPVADNLLFFLQAE